MDSISTDGQVKAIFQSYRRANARLGFADVGTLGELLNRRTDKARAQDQSGFAADQELARLFASAAIEMWHRALHSFIVSAGLTSTSKIWSAVSGYYASHYVVRGYAHLLGRYLLYRQKKVVVLGIHNGSYYCALESKNGSDREHKAYWKFVRDSAPFGTDPFFRVEVDAVPKSDGAHRNKANYADHVGRFGRFEALTLEAAVERIQRIAEIEISALPVPDAEKFPDLDSVQIIAYHRIVKFRNYLDDLLGDENRFWNTHRKPSWCTGLVDFQIVEPKFVIALGQA